MKPTQSKRNRHNRKFLKDPAKLQEMLTLYDSGLTFVEVGVKVGIGASIVSKGLNTLPGFRPRPTFMNDPIQIKRVIDLYATGQYDQRQIAAILDKSTNTIGTMLTRNAPDGIRPGFKRGTTKFTAGFIHTVTPEITANIIELYAAEVPIKKIAEDYGTSVKVIKQIIPPELLRVKLVNNDQLLLSMKFDYISGLTLEDLEQKYGFSAARIGQVLNQKFPDIIRTDLTADMEKINQMIEQCRSGLPATIIGRNFGVVSGHVSSILRKYIPDELANTQTNISQHEIEILEFIKSFYPGEIILNTRKVISPLELDIYIPKKKIAIEFNGCYWHSTEHKHRDYHHNKALSCMERKVNLIHVFEHDWKYRKEQIKKDIQDSITGKFQIPKSLGIIECAFGHPIQKVLERKGFTKSSETKPKRILVDKKTLEFSTDERKAFEIFDQGTITFCR